MEHLTGRLDDAVMTRRGPGVVIAGASHWHMERQVAAFTRAGAQIVGVQDDDSRVAQRWAQKLGCDTFDTVAQLLEVQQAELALVMSAHDQVTQTIGLVCAADLPMVVEKPAGITATDLAAAVNQVQEHDIFCAVAFVNRLTPFWDHVEHPQEEFSTTTHPASARFRIVNGTPERYRVDGCPWMLDRRRSGGGALRNLGSHLADAVHQLAPGRWEVTSAVSLTLPHLRYQDDQQRTDQGRQPSPDGRSPQEGSLGIDDHTTAIIRGPQGQSAVIEAGYVWPDRDGSDHEWTVLDPHRHVTDNLKQLEVTTPAGTTVHPGMDMASRYDHFAVLVVDSWRAQAPSPVPLQHALEAAELIDRIYASATPPPSDHKRSDSVAANSAQHS